MDFYLLFGLLVLTVLTIITTHRFPFEKNIREEYNIDREYWVPVLTLSILVGVGVINPPQIQRVIVSKIDIIVLIFTFGVIAEGLAKAQVFEYISHSAVESFNSDTKQLLLGLFVVTSLLTLITTNDIVILVLTPILIDIAYRANIQNAKLLLLSQFVAANTLSMGLLIGSPTNIIISETLDIGFFTYFEWMILPALITAISSAAVLYGVYTVSKHTSLFESYQIKTTYTEPDLEKPKLDSEMKSWVGLFIVFLVLVIIVTEQNFSLLWCSIPTLLLIFLYWRQSDYSTESISNSIKSLPYGVFFFGLVFFTLADAISATEVLVTQIYPLLESQLDSSILSVVVGVFGSGILVNIVNDLPAAALIAEMLTQITVPKNLSPLFYQSLLVGLNIGAYVTQAGALAGLIWFNQMRVYSQRYESRYESSLTLPNRLDLVKFGVLNFVITGGIISIVLSIFTFV